MEAKGYSDSREEEEEEEAAREESSSKHYSPFSSPSTTNFTTTPPPHLHHHRIINNPHHQNPWLGMYHDHQSPDATPNSGSHNSSSWLGLHQQQDAASNKFINHRKQLDFMDLSVGSNKDDESNFQGSGVGLGGGGGCNSNNATHAHATSSSINNINEPAVEKEHMFDKVVTPSDVGKLNRLVIPKQHAEKYFPLDSSSNEKGLLLNFEDSNGKSWRFRYSYWNSSQSYVMTKGWSRFVKEKKLDAGDIVSFQRGLGELYRHRLYIDWRRRPDHVPDPSSTLITPFLLPSESHYSVRWGGRLYSLPSPPTSTITTTMPRHNDHFQHLNYNNMYTFHHHQQQQYLVGGSHHNNYNELNLGSGSVCYLRSTPSMSMGDQNLPGQQERGNIAPMIIDSVPVVHHHHHEDGRSGVTVTTSSSNTNSNAGKRLRLFGVNMECASSPAEEPKFLSTSASAPHVTMAHSLPSSSLPPIQRLRVPHEDPLSPSARYEDQRGQTSVLFDLVPSFQYRQ